VSSALPVDRQLSSGTRLLRENPALFEVRKPSEIENEHDHEDEDDSQISRFVFNLSLVSAP